MSYRQKMFSKPQNHHKSTPRPNFAIISNSFDIKDMPNLTASSESPENPQIEFTNHQKYLKNCQNCPQTHKIYLKLQQQKQNLADWVSTQDQIAK